MHQVKPWFEGRLDFAPVVSFLGDQEFPLQGGAVGYFLDRKAAVFIFHRRLDAISLFVFRAGDLPWPARGGEPLGNTDSRSRVQRDPLAERGARLRAGLRSGSARADAARAEARRRRLKPRILLEPRHPKRGRDTAEGRGTCRVTER